MTRGLVAGCWLPEGGEGGVEGAVGEEGFAGGFGEEDLVAAEELIDFTAMFERNEEDFAFSGGPGGEELVVGEEDGWGVGEG